MKQLWTQISSRTSNRLKLYKPSNQCLHWMGSPKWFKHRIEFYFHDWKHACAFLCLFFRGGMQLSAKSIWPRCTEDGIEGDLVPLGDLRSMIFPWTFDALESVPGIPGHVSHDFPTIGTQLEAGAGSAVSRSTCSLVAEWSLFHGITFWCRKVAFWISWMVLTCLK